MALRLQSLTTRLSLANALAVCAILAASSAWILQAEREERREAAQQRVLRSAQASREILEAALREGNLTAQAERYLDAEPAVARLRLVHADGTVAFDSHAGSTPELPVSPAVRAAVTAGVPTVVDGEGELTEVVAPLEGETGRAAFAFALSYRDATRHLRWSLATVGRSLLLAALVAASIGFLFARHLARRLDRLGQEAQRIAEGERGEPLHADRDDELGRLAGRLNAMAARLQENIAKLEESNQQLARANRELTEFDQLKSDLIANVSHELRTPLTAIKGYTDYMIERKLGAISGNQERGLQVMQRNLERLSRTINALLDYSRLEAGHVTLNRQDFSLTLLVEQVHQTLRSMIEQKGLSFSIALPSGLPEVRADREKLAQVFENLIINAVKFTPEGGRVEILGEVDASGAAVDVSVADSGIGIAADELTRIFARFHQVDGSSRRRFGGVGLGLAIVKSILEAHEVEIRVDSEPGRGTAFRFALPLATAPAPAEEAGGPAEANL